MYCPRCTAKLWKQEKLGKIIIGYCEKCMTKTSLGNMGRIRQREFDAMQRDEFRIGFRDIDYDEQMKKAWRASL